jgi:hypothetical protein
MKVFQRGGGLDKRNGRTPGAFLEEGYRTGVVAWSKEDMLACRDLSRELKRLPTLVVGPFLALADINHVKVFPGNEAAEKGGQVLRGL